MTVNRTIIKNVIRHYGPLIQKVIAMEEMSELIKEISKDIRGIGDREHILEELADVMIVSEELKEIYQFDDEEIDDMFNRKMRRVEKRMITEKRKVFKHAREEVI